MDAPPSIPAPPPTLIYAVPLPQNLRRAGMILLIWAALQLPLALALLTFNAIDAVRRLALPLSTPDSVAIPSLVYALLLIALSLALAHFAVTTLKNSLALFRGQAQFLGRHLFWVTFVEVLAYCGIAAGLMVCAIEPVRRNVLTLACALAFVLLYLAIPLSVTFARLTPQRAATLPKPPPPQATPAPAAN